VLLGLGFSVSGLGWGTSAEAADGCAAAAGSCWLMNQDSSSMSNVELCPVPASIM
jgi:hypothetical protein